MPRGTFSWRSTGRAWSAALCATTSSRLRSAPLSLRTSRRWSPHRTTTLSACSDIASTLSQWSRARCRRSLSSSFCTESSTHSRSFFVFSYCCFPAFSLPTLSLTRCSCCGLWFDCTSSALLLFSLRLTCIYHLCSLVLGLFRGVYRGCHQGQCRSGLWATGGNAGQRLSPGHRVQHP